MEPAWVKVCGSKFRLTSRTVIQPNGGTRDVPCYSLTKTECTKQAFGIYIIFASDYPYECLANMMKFVKTLDLTEEEKEKLFHLNAEKYILSLS